MTTPAPLTCPDDGAPGRWLIAVALATVAVLVLALHEQVFDTNFYSLWEATGLLAGEHPYRDFFEWGVPLQAALSAGVQWIVGNRMVGEFVLIHWAFIIGGAVISFDLGYRLTHSIAATAFMAAIGLAMIPDTPTFHYPKLFFYPLTVWLAWRYLDRPRVRLAAALGLVTALAFLFRHDHGLYIGIVAVFTCLLARVAAPERPRRDTVRDSLAYTAAAAALLVPWLLVVQANEGAVGYVRSRADLYNMWSGRDAYRGLLSVSPMNLIDGWRPQPVQPGVVRFRWTDDISGARQEELEREFGLHRLEGPDADQRWRYQADDVNAPRMYALYRVTDATEGLDWTRLEQRNAWLPTLEPSRVWLAQITLVLPVLLLAWAGVMLLRAWWAGVRSPPDAFRLLVGGTLLLVVDARLIREASYAHLVGPLTAALAARFLVPGPRPSPVAWARVVTAGALAFVSALAALACFQPTRVLPLANLHEARRVFGRMLVSPPIDAFATKADIDAWTVGRDHGAWVRGELPAWPEILLRYLHDCAATGDRVLVSGQTPYHISYLIDRPVAGGHLFWHHRWRSDPAGEAVLLALLERQSVPFAFSTSDPVLNDLQFYPRIHAYFETNYAELPGSRRLLLVDQRRRPTGTFGPYGFPCFK